MKNTLFAAVAAVGLLVAGPAFADHKNNPSKNHNGGASNGAAFIQVNGSIGTGAINLAPTVAKGKQLNVLTGKVSQDVEAAGAVSSVNQSNTDGVIQVNAQLLNGAINFAPTVAKGKQGNFLVGKASQSVTAVGAQGAVSQSNKDGSLQVNVAGLDGAVNLAPTLAKGKQFNMGVGKASQSVVAVGASSIVSQSNKDGGVQVNLAGASGALNMAPTVAVGKQMNLGVHSASQSVGSVGASASVSQTNRN